MKVECGQCLQTQTFLQLPDRQKVGKLCVALQRLATGANTQSDWLPQPRAPLLFHPSEPTVID